MAPLQKSERAGITLSPAERIASFCLPSFGDMLFICVLLGVIFGLQGRALGIDGDVGWSLRIGLQTLAGGLPRHEFLLSTTFGQPVVYWEWLAQVAYALAYRFAGLNGVVALAGGIVALTGAGLYAAIRRRGTPLLLALALALAGIGLTSITWTARAQLFSLPLTLWWSENLWRYWREGENRRLWCFLPAMVLWANLHGGFLGGIILLGTAVAVAWLFPGSRGHANPRHLTYTLGGTLLATLLTPWGFALPAHILAYISNPLIARYTQEYQSPDFHSMAGLLFLALVFALVATWLYSAVHAPLSPRLQVPGVRPLALAHIAVWTTLAFVSVRFVPLWALIVLPILADAFPVARQSAASGYLEQGASRQDDSSSRHEREASGSITSLQPARLRLRPLPLSTWISGISAFSRRIEAVDRQVGRGIWSAIAVAFVLVTLAGGGRVPGAATPILDARFDATIFPVLAAQRLHTEGLPSGRGFTTYEWGGYLDLALPGYHVFVDSRSDAYSRTLLHDYATLIGLGPGWHDLLRRYAIRWALLPASSPLAQVLDLTHGWRCASEDDVGIAVLCVLSTS